MDWTGCWFCQYSRDGQQECVPEVWRDMTSDWWDGKRQLHWGISQLWVLEWLWQGSRFVGSEQAKMMSWIWIVIAGGRKPRVAWEMKVRCCQDQLLLCLSSFWWLIGIHPFEVEHSFHHQQVVGWCISWIIGWCHDQNVTYWICWPWRNGLWRCWL